MNVALTEYEDLDDKDEKDEKDEEDLVEKHNTSIEEISREIDKKFFDYYGLADEQIK